MSFINLFHVNEISVITIFEEPVCWILAGTGKSASLSIAQTALTVAGFESSSSRRSAKVFAFFELVRLPHKEVKPMSETLPRKSETKLAGFFE